MKQLRRIVGLFLIIAIACSFAACGKGTSKTTRESKDIIESSNLDSFIFKDKEEFVLGTPDKELNAQEVYKNLEYTPEMFYGDYRLLGGEEAVEQYREDMDYIDYEMSYSKQLTAIPYRFIAGENNLHSIVSYIKGYQFVRAYYQIETGSLLDLLCSFEINGSTITLVPLETFELDEETNTINYAFSDYVFTYDFSFCGRDLTLSKDGKSVTMRTGLDVSTDNPHFHVSTYLSPGSESIEQYDYLRLHYSSPSDSSAMFETEGQYNSWCSAVVELTNDGLFTLSLQKDDGVKTYQFVYFYGGDDGIVLTDGTNTYYYNDDYSDYYKTNLRSYLSEEDDAKFDELSQSQIETIVEKKENLVEELANAFKQEGISVTFNEQTGEMAMDASVLFGGDSSELTDIGKEILNKFINVYTNIVFSDEYKGFVTKTMVEGHTAPISGSTYESGLPLSVERAEVVKNYCLSAECGVKPEYIAELASMFEAVGMSNGTPVYDDNGNIDLDASRRVSFRFIINIDMN